MSGNTVDAELVRLTEEIEVKLDLLHEGDARRSDFVLAQEAYGDGVIALLEGALDRITPEQKVAAFDAVAKAIIENRLTEVRERMAGTHVGDAGADHDAAVSEAMEAAVLGADCFDALNKFGDIFKDGPDR